MRRASASLPRSLYRRADLAAAADWLGGRVQARLLSRGQRWHLSILTDAGLDARAALAEMLNEALLRGLREMRLKEVGPLAAAVAGRMLDHGFPSDPADPLEEMEPQVRADRRRETQALIERARGIP